MKYEKPDVFYLEEWGCMLSKKDGGEYLLYEDNIDGVYIIYPMTLRSILNKVDGITYYDSITPFGPSGPYISDLSDKTIVNQLLKRLDSFCLDKNIITEYVRFAPWLKKNSPRTRYQILDNNCTWYINLNDDFWLNSYTSNARQSSRKAKKSGVKIKIENSVDNIDLFLENYKEMAKKNNIDAYYMFTKEELISQFNTLKDNIIFAYAMYNEICVSSSMFLLYNKNIHYHLSGNNPKYSSLCANNYLLTEICYWGQANGYETFHLGGAPKSNIGLHKFKDKMASRLKFEVGTNVINEKIYQEIKDSYKDDLVDDYFPPYRK